MDNRQKSKLLSVASLLRVLATLSVAFLAQMPGQAQAGAIGVDWDLGVNGTKTGDLDGISVSISPVFDPTAMNDFSGADFSGAPLSASQERVGYAAATEWTATFGSGVSDLLLYAIFWRGASAGGPDPVSYTFDQPFTILSGFANATIDGNTLKIPITGFQSGILKFAGPITSLSVTTSATSTGAGQGMTFGVAAIDSICEPRTQGFWRRVCRRDHPDQPDQSILTAELCEDLNPDPPSDPCERARSQFAALLLNIDSDRLEGSCIVIATGLSVDDLVETIEALLGEGTADSCQDARALAASVNEGGVTP